MMSSIVIEIKLQILSNSDSGGHYVPVEGRQLTHWQQLKQLSQSLVSDRLVLLESGYSVMEVAFLLVFE